MAKKTRGAAPDGTAEFAQHRDHREPLAGIWPRYCDNDTCAAPPELRIRVKGETYFLCFRDAARPPFSTAAARDIDLLRTRS